MPKVIDYYLSLISPWAYLGAPRLADMARRHDAEIRVRPIALSLVFPATGGVPLGQRAAERQAYRLVELERWSRFLDMPLNLHPAHFPVPDDLAGRLVLAAEAADGDPFALAQAILTAVWVEERNITEADTLAAAASATGHDADALLAAAQSEESAAAYRAVSEEAVARGVFGSPSYLYGDELFWGQDRLDFLERALASG